MTKKTTSWGGVAAWYDQHLAGSDTYHEKVIAPNLVRVVAPKGKKLIEVGCGEGYFSRLMQKHGALVDASDIAPELIQIAKQKAGGPRYFAASADALTFAKPASYDAALAVLTLQNMEALAPVCKEIARVLKTNGTFVFVLNHPILRVPKQTSWEFDGKAGVQYRRVDAYLSQAKIPMDMHPGKTAEKGKPTLTYSFHRPLQEYIKVLGNAGFVVTHLEEWISHKISEPGPRADAENRARKEFPLFMCIAATRSGDMR